MTTHRVFKASGLRKRLVRRAAVATVALITSFGSLAGSAGAATLVYGNGEYAGETGPQHFFIALERTEVEGRKQPWCMNSYFKAGEDVPGMGKYCHGAGGDHVQYNEQEPPDGSATAQGWVDSGATGYIWAWAEYDG